MNQRIGEKLIELARAMKPRKATGQYFHISSLIRKNRIICVGWNDYTRYHPSYKFGNYENYKGFTNAYKPSIHSEISSIIRFGEEDLSEMTLVNIRIGNMNQVALSKPCFNCQRVLKQLNIKRIYYSNNVGEFEEFV